MHKKLVLVIDQMLQISQQQREHRFPLPQRTRSGACDPGRRSPATLPVAIPGVAYSQKFTPGGGSGSGYTLTLSGLPSTTGLTFRDHARITSHLAAGPCGARTLACRVDTHVDAR